MGKEKNIHGIKAIMHSAKNHKAIKNVFVALVSSTILRYTPFSGQKCLEERGFLMAKYDVEFKKKCIKAFAEKKKLRDVYIKIVGIK